MKLTQSQSFSGIATVVLLMRLKSLMNGRKISLMLAWTVAVVMIGAGIAVLAGWLMPKEAPKSMRLMLGVVFLLMGLYRFLMTRLQAKQAEKVDE